MNSPLRVFYGGSFDPVHNGHLAIARAARDALHAEVALVPARDPPHKDATHADADQRAQLLALAIEGEPGLRVDPRELHRAGPSYTFDTLTELRAEAGPGAPLVWLVGADSVLQLHTWHRWRELFDLALHLGIGQRRITFASAPEHVVLAAEFDTDYTFAQDDPDAGADELHRIGLHYYLKPGDDAEDAADTVELA